MCALEHQRDFVGGMVELSESSIRSTQLIAPSSSMLSNFQVVHCMLLHVCPTLVISSSTMGLFLGNEPLHWIQPHEVKAFALLLVTHLSTLQLPALQLGRQHNGTKSLNVFVARCLPLSAPWRNQGEKAANGKGHAECRSFNLGSSSKHEGNRFRVYIGDCGFQDSSGPSTSQTIRWNM